MKHSNNRKSRQWTLLICLVCLLCLALVACRTETPGEETTFSDTLPEVIPTVPEASETATTETETDPPTQTETTTAATETEEPTVTTTNETETETETEPEAETETETTYEAIAFPSGGLPEYADYITASRIAQILSDTDALVASVGDKAVKMYRRDQLVDVAEAFVFVSDGEVVVDLGELIRLYGVDSDEFGYVLPSEAAAVLGKNALVYDNKMVVFYAGAPVLDAYKDMYTLEAMYLYTTGADDVEILNAFIDLPDVVSNGHTNAVYYTAPDLNLGVQSSVYFAQMGANQGVDVGPCIVAGEGYYLGDGKRFEANHTVVRVFNEQQALTAQFLAFDASVLGGVQVAAAAVGSETLIATTPFVGYEGPDGDVRVFDVFGGLRMEIYLHPVMAGPYIIKTGRFVEGMQDEVLLVAAQTMDEDGWLPYALIDLSDGSVITMATLDCAFGLSEDPEDAREVQLSVRRTQSVDTLILYFPTVRAVYEGSAENATFVNAHITVPENTNGVYASANPGEKYILTVGETKEEENRSFIVVYDLDGQDGGLLDVGFHENIFFTARYWEDNDDTYVSTGTFNHIRCDLSNGVMSALNKANTSEKVTTVFDNATYADYTFSNVNNYINAYRAGHQFLEPCFTHRWNKISGTGNLKNFVDDETGEHLYVSIGQDGKYTDYLELGSSFYIGTYADGILDLAKLRIYPLRSFLRTMAVEFRGENGNPEHLVGVSPVHEHEIDVAGTVGDYNVRMIRGFQIYMMELYGSVENINAVFGTDFADEYEIDPPRQADRGTWDAYKGDYFNQWVLYNRYIVSKRIIEAYREALLAGYPPESISAHQIPDAEAVAGLLGDAGTRITPIDVVTTCGTSYGGTRYGTFYYDSNFISYANNAGQWSMSIGEYCSLSDDQSVSFAQLQWLWKNGVHMIHQLPFTDSQAQAEEAAIRQLAMLNKPRPSYAGGTINAVNVLQGGKNYTIIQLGEPADGNDVGLLKSVTSDGKWEGTVYLVPFHAHVNVTTLDALNAPMDGTTNTWSTGKLGTYLKNSDVVELTLKASYSGEGKAYVRFSLYQKGCEVPASVVTYELNDTTTPYRYVLSNQIYLDNAEVRVTVYTEGGDEADIHMTDLKGTLQQDAVAVKFFDGSRAATGYRNQRAHRGGVTFDLVDRQMCN